jgi:uncharacterized membrane protein (DUF441 family)
LWARSNLVASSAAILLAIRFTRLTFLFPILEKRGVELGLLFLTLAMLVPFAMGQVQVRTIFKSLWTVPGILAIVGGAVATNLNGRGLNMLTGHNELMVSLIVGSILGIVIWGGIPVGPLMAAGVTYVLFGVFQWLAGLWR